MKKIKTAVITGATKGIGYAIAEIFAENGIDLCINSRNEDDLSKTAEILSSKHNIKVHTQKCDMSIKEEVTNFAAFVQEQFEGVDIIVNNAGVFLPGMIHEEEEGTLEKQIETNLYSAYHMTRAILPKMIKKQKGHVFNMCSIASIIAYPNGGSYSISKFALHGFSKVLREEMKEKGIRVTAILPGATWSNSWAGVDLPLARLMQASDIANAVWSAHNMSSSTVVEDIILRPQLGDL